MKRIPIKLKLGKVYSVRFKYKDALVCKFIQPTKCGFNFLNLETNKCILNNHLYKSKCENHLSEDWFFVNDRITIKEI